MTFGCDLRCRRSRPQGARRRGEHTRLRFLLQLTTVRYVGPFLPDPLDVPTVVLERLARSRAWNTGQGPKTMFTDGAQIELMAPPSTGIIAPVM